LQVSSAKPAVRKVDPVIFGIIKEADAHVALRVTTQSLQGDHGILCLEDAELEWGAGQAKLSSNNDTMSSMYYSVLKSDVVENAEAESSTVGDGKVVFRVPSVPTYTYSTEYLQQLSKQRYRFIYESVPTKVSHMDGECLLASSNGNNCFQLKCSLNSSLLFIPPSKVCSLFHILQQCRLYILLTQLASLYRRLRLSVVILQRRSIIHAIFLERELYPGIILGPSSIL
jgi:hypothetical protein